jgi:hypothetical protein
MTLEELLDYKPYLCFATDSYLMSVQGWAGIGFDIEAARDLVVRIDAEMREIEELIEPQLPLRPLNKGETDRYRIPAKPFKKDGTLSSAMVNWMERTGAKLHTERDILLEGNVYPIRGGEATVVTGVMRLKNQDDLKNYLLENGWIPTMWNLKKDKRGKPVRDERGQVIQTSPKFQENGRMCPNLEEMEGELIKPVIRYLSLRNRRSTLESATDEDKGWLNNERLAYDGRLSASSAGYTPSFRHKHSCVVNVPKAKDHVVYGKEMRSLYIAKRPGYVLVGYDGKALENRVEASYCRRYEGGERHAEIIMSGDPHVNNALAFFPDELAALGFTHADPAIEDHPVASKYRGKAKNGRYCLGYGGGAPKLAATLGVPLNRGQVAYDAFWEANLPLKILKQRLEAHWEHNGKKWIKGIDGRRIMCRSKHSLVNYLFQSCGAIAMSYSALFMHKMLGPFVLDNNGELAYNYKGKYLYRVGFFHDELIWEVPAEVADEIAEMGCESIRKAGKYLKMSVPLDGTPKVGRSWMEIH